MLLGAEIFYNLLCIGQIRLGKNLPILQKTVLGWVLSGPIPVHNGNFKQTSCNLTTSQEIHNLLTKFWEVEEPIITKNLHLSSEEQICEDIFQITTRRDESGRFIVQIPLKLDPSHLGNSRECALKRFHSTENKLSKQPTLREPYTRFIEEYHNLGHMVKVPSSQVLTSSYFLPHHAVVNENNKTTRLRVVFDASSRSDTGYSLNDLQYVGPTIQDSLFSILLRFRQGHIAVGADLVKMFRQIRIHESQRHLQTILWRDDPSQELETFQLCTVTYGTASASWLSVRCLKQLALEHTDTFPHAANVLSKDFYMDDLLYSCQSEEEAVRLCDELTSILSAGCFQLQKWSSNSKQVLDHVQSNNPQTIINIGSDQRAKTLGVFWSCSSDHLMYSISESFSNLRAITKRSILSDIAQIFDPLGLLGPCIIIGKILLQQLWSLKLHWHESLPSNLDSRWRRFREELPVLNMLKVPRHVICPTASRIELHGFSDASVEAYGACLYIRSISSCGEITVHLLTAKSKVSPLKSLTIPKLELCGAFLLTQLVVKVNQSMSISFDDTFLWCDSTVCLAWIKTEANKLQPFVQNRVAHIQSQTQAESWHYINTAENPADLLSRGVSPTYLLNYQLWWNGPTWLSHEHDKWPIAQVKLEGELPGLKKQLVSFPATCTPDILKISSYSSFSKLQRVTAYVLRYISNCKLPKKDRSIGGLTASELSTACTHLTITAQRQSFRDDYFTLKRDKPLPKSSKLLSLNPFIDDKGVIRVGGRIQNSNSCFAFKHPAVLSGKHQLSKLLCENEHKRLLHAGPQQTLYSLRQRFWVTSGRNLTRQTVRTCIKCFRCNPSVTLPLMGVLPKARVTPAPPFHTTGVDYAGPVMIKDKPGRGAKLTKAYIALFVCFATRAIHLELVSSLTTETFIGAFRRFTARRGKPQEIWSDNGSNFRGAEAELRELASFLAQNKAHLQENISNTGVNWKFIPAFSPHMGGIWEAGVKSAKKHLRRILGSSNLTFEEYYTVLTQIEAVLNSRPIAPMSSSPDDPLALTPSHFLIGRPATALPDPDFTETPMTRLSRHQLLQQLQQHFWRRWSNEYLSELQQRIKWRSHQCQLQLGSLVVLRDDNLPPLHWKLGRVSTLHPGADGKVRVATVRTSSGAVKRAVTKLCVLPIEPEPVQKPDCKVSDVKTKTRS
ncbi:unnamed protein product [Acanthoscelides obtectus]|uniref:Integrase catalytic domain-containing protein n=1 Tax=Acanthoscelides obtectus TaxID=200917 RepID=A0A9P0VPT0_ACAOB|nr:unnamed protein product [Acanthoscelides obtectus]CAK1623348.1 hypothetical protein AOBTE_LOCUS1945 [Acanthoscelides obtectus]